MTPDEAEQRIQQGYLNAQEVLKIYWRRRMKLFAAVMVRYARLAREAVIAP